MRVFTGFSLIRAVHGCAAADRYPDDSGSFTHPRDTAGGGTFDRTVVGYLRACLLLACPAP
ncbi:hypothetical protein BJ989_000914 [Nocardioides perillae]|uniref:Uncharacterized protein n=1 Tax=Nocardioides perillae TaxID=1119534 RepID=A0A7Y9RQT9_9ACTN|nr:hypothetical protein [Nocardioides perillae]